MRFVLEGPTAGVLWRRALLRAVLAPLVVLAPLIALAPTRDHRFNIYWHGGLFRDDPLRIGPHTTGSLPGYLRMGNFRLFGRMLEKALDLAAYTLGDTVGLPANVALRLVSFLSAVLVCLAATLLAESVVARTPLFRQPPSTLAAVTPFAVAMGFVAAGGSSPAVLFGGLYFASAALVLAVAASLCRIGFATRFRLWWIPLLLAGGAALAAFNEIAYLAPPLATVAVLVRGRLVLEVPWRRLFTGPPVRALALLWAGFLPIFLAVRVVIQRYCAAGPCYKGSDIHLGLETATSLPVRLFAWLPPLMWRGAVTGGSSRPWLGGVVLIAALVILGLLAWQAVRDLPRLPAVDRRAAVAVAATGGVLVALGAVMGSLNVDVQQMVTAGRWGLGWRDSAVTTTAGGLVVAAVTPMLRGRRRLTATVVLLAVTGSVSATANKRFRDTTMASPAAVLADRVAQEMADFDRSPAGAVRRCALRTEFAALHPGSAYTLARFDKALDTAARQRSGMPFCRGVTTDERGR
nr:hypothetical protein [uncultured Actinoplanes sp.]